MFKAEFIPYTRRAREFVKMVLLIPALFSLAISLEAQTPRVQVVLFTHIEDNTPAGTLGSPESRTHYLQMRPRLLAMADLSISRAVQWSFQPDWKFLLAALMYEDSITQSSTGGKNLLRYLKEDKGVFLDPHSHEKLGYNYTDVAHLLDSLGVGGSTVIGGHIWDPSLPQFQNWDRFRVPVRGTKYPWALWRGTILMGSGTPNHVNDPTLSGIWRPKDRFNYFTDDSIGNIYCSGQYKGTVEGIAELAALYDSGRVNPSHWLTSSIHIKPADITAPNGIAIIDSAIFRPLILMRNAGKVSLTNFTSMINEWKTTTGGRAFLYWLPSDAAGNQPVPLAPGNYILLRNYPNPFNPSTAIQFYLPEHSSITLTVYDALGQSVKEICNGELKAGWHSVQWDARGTPSGIYICVAKTPKYRSAIKLLVKK